MRFLELNLMAFGPFTDIRLDLSRGELGLHMVYGPNEAGKSTALRAFQAVLFGIPKHSRDNFLHPYKDLRIGARLQNFAGEELPFVRRKGNKDTLLDAEHAQGSALPESRLEPFLRGVDATTFRQVFGIDRDELQRGGNELRLLRGLVGESLFAAGLGGAGLANVLSDLETEAGELFGKKRNSAIREARRNYDQAVKERREAAFPFAQWQRLQTELEQARSLKQAVVDRLTELRAKESRNARIRASLNLLAQRDRLLTQLAELGDITELPESYSAEERSRCQGEIAELEQRIESLRDKLDAAEGLHAQMARIRIPDGLLEHETEIRDLQERLGAILKATRDRDRSLRVKRDELAAQIERGWRDLGIDTSWEHLDLPRIPPDRRVAIQDLGNDEKQVRGLPEELAAQRRDLQLALESARLELEQLGAVRDTGSLRYHCQQARKQGDMEAELAQLDQSLVTLESEADRQLAALGLWNGTLADLARLPVPLRETVDRFEQDEAGLRQQLGRINDSQRQTMEQLAETQQEIATLQHTAQVPTEEELRQVRGLRDRTWQLVRGAWLDDSIDENAIRELIGKTPAQLPNPDLANAYEQHVRQSDSLADRLRREADRVAALAQHHAQQTRLQERLSKLDKSIESCRQELSEHQTKWSQLWADCQIQRPLPPREMRGWLERRGELIHTARDIERQQTEREALGKNCEILSRQIAECLAAEESAVPSGESLNQLLQRAEARLQHEEEQDRRRKQLHHDLERCQRDLDRLAGEEVRAIQKLKSWQEKWYQAMQQIGCPDHASAAQANARMSQLEELSKRADQMADLDTRIAAIDEEVRDFQQRVSHLIQRIAPDLAECPATDAAAQLQSRLDEAQRLKVRLDHLREDAERTQAELGTALDRQRESRSRLDELCRVAGVADFELLPAVERSSSEVADRRRQRETVEQQLLQLGGGLSIEQLAHDAEGHAADELAAQLADLREEIEAQEEERDRVVAEVRELENRCEAADRSTKAAEADERALGILAKMHSDAEHYLRLRLAATVLRHQIETHRAENHDPLLARASDLFSRITCNEFAGLQTEYDESDQATIVGLRRTTKELIPVESMSGGTRDQLYLALRLGYLEHQLARPEPMPLVVDDILVEFDDNRALATLQVLTELSQQTQVIFFTHHRHLLDLAQASLSEGLFVHELDARATRKVESSVASAARRPR